MLEWYAQNLQMVNLGIYIFFVFLACFAAVWGVVVFFKYNISVIVREKVGETGERVWRRSAKKVRSLTGEGYEIKLLMRNLRLPWPDAESITNHSGIRFKTHIEYLKIGENESDYKPIKTIGSGVSEAKLTAMDNDVVLWSEAKTYQKIKKYENIPLWQKIAPWAALGLVAMVVLVSIIVLLDEAKDFHDKTNDAAVEVSKSIEKASQNLLKMEQTQQAKQDIITTNGQNEPQGPGD